MKDSMKACQHTLSEDVVYKEVVVIGNGPSGMVTSFMLAGNVPYLKEIPDDLPIDEMLRARLSNLPQGQSLYDTDLTELAEGLEGRSQNPIPLLMDNLLRPCADLGIQADSLIEWKFEIEKQISHVVLGRGAPGGSWHTFPPTVRTLSPAAWLSLPPHAALGTARLSARAVANYCRRYVHACKLQKYFRSGVTVTSVTRLPQSDAPRCPDTQCPLNAQFCVSGYDNTTCRGFRYACRRVVVCCGGGDRPNALAPRLARHALHALAPLERALRTTNNHVTSVPPSVLIVGSGVSAADAVCLSRGAGLHARHLHRAPADALARLAPQHYPDYCQVYKMMCDGPTGNHNNYTPYPDHMIVDITQDSPASAPSDIEDYALTLKRVKLLNLTTKEITEIQVYIIGVFIGSKPDLFFLQTNYLDCIDTKFDCEKCSDESKIAKRKIEEKQCFLKNHWMYIKSMLGQSIQSCKSRYLNYSEINGNNDTKCEVPDCNRRNDKTDKLDKLEKADKIDINDKLQIIPYTDEEKVKCQCDSLNPYSSGLGFGIDPKKPVDGRNNPIAIDKSSHEILNAPGGMYALGPLTADNFVRFIPGGALAAVSHMHRNKQ
ncbi:oxidative stress-induced growth inhibitor 1-like [Anticarsia gemmatalis]|uniref:oxidative stress-induced growth inhibitor 1-like n=1 Tax=Anticarsia gemmatalis TaxID=129554 RepID=UPI003F766A77